MFFKLCTRDFKGCIKRGLLDLFVSPVLAAPLTLSANKKGLLLIKPARYQAKEEQFPPLHTPSPSSLTLSFSEARWSQDNPVKEKKKSHTSRTG